MLKTELLANDSRNLIQFILKVQDTNIIYHEVKGATIIQPISKTKENDFLNYLLNRTIDAKQIVCIDDLSKDDAVAEVYSPSFKIKSFIGLPILGRDEDVLGLFYTTDTTPTSTTKAQISALTAALKQASSLLIQHQTLKTSTAENKKLLIENRNQKKILKSAKAGTWIYNLKTESIIYDSRWAEIVGYTLEELKPFSYETWENLVHKNDIKQVEKIISNYVAKKTDTYSATFRMRHKKGHYVWVKASGNIVEWTEENEPLLMIGSHLDISSQVESEETIKKNNLRIEEMQRISKIGSWNFDFETKTFLFSKRFIEIFGVSFGNSFDKTLDYIIEEDKARVVSAKQECLKLGIPYDIIYKIKNASGEICIIEEHGSAIKNEKGKLTSAYGTLRDITKKKNEEQRLKLLESVITQTKDAVIITEAENSDPYGPKIIYVNAAFTEMTGYSAEEVIGKTPKILQGAKSINTELKNLNKALKDHKPHDTTTINYKKNGEPFWINFSITPVNDENGKCTHWISIQRDVTKKKTEEQQSKLLESVVTNTKDAVLITEAEPYDESGPKIIYANDSFTKMTGYTLNEILGKSPKFLHGPGTKKTNLKKLNKAIANYESQDITTINYKKNGDPFWVNFSVTPVTDDNGKCTHWISIQREVTDEVNYANQQNLLRDISYYFTEKETVKESLQLALKALLKLLDYSYAEVWIPNAENNELSLLCSESHDDYGKDFKQLNSNSFFKLDEGLQGHVLKTQETLFFKDIQNNDSFERKVNAKKSGLQSAIGLPLNANDETEGVLLLLNKTPLKESTLPKTLFNELQRFLGKEVKRKNLEIEINQVFNFAPEMIVINNNKNFFTKVNPAAIEILGYSEKELLSQSFYNFIHPDDRDKTQEQTTILRSGTPIYNFQNRYITKAGKVIWLNWTATPNFKNGLTYSVAKDVTELKKNEDALLKLNRDLKNYTKKLETSNAELEQFAYVASHDLQEPLRMVTSFLNQLKLKYEDALDEKAHTYIHYAVDGAVRMRKIILDILEYSRLGTEEESLEDVSLKLTVEDILSYYKNEITRKNIEIIYTNLPMIKVKRSVLFQIFNNLIGNAIKYGAIDKKCKIEISAEEKKDNWEIVVKDNGIGIDKAHLEKIFIIFQRLHGKNEYSGSGVGLAIVKKLVESNQGKIWVESEINEGSRFYVQLPK